MTYEPDFETEIADHLNDMAAELSELREIAETVTPDEETRTGFADVRDAVAGTLGTSAAVVLPGWAR